MASSKAKKYPESLMEIDWSDLPVRISNILLRKAAGYWGKSEENQEKFDGFNEANVVNSIGNLLEASGLDVFYECEYKGGGKQKCDIYGESWRDKKGVYIEVKLLWEDNEKRLNYNTPDKCVILKDIAKLKSIPSLNFTRLFVVAVHSGNGCKESEKSFLDKVIRHISARTDNAPTWSRVNLDDVVNLKKESLPFFDVVCWEV